MDIFGETEREQGPSWARDNWPIADLDEVNAGLDPTRMTIEKVAAKAKEAAVAAGKSDADIRQAAQDSIRAMMLIRTYRVRGHLAADLDPLGLSKRELPADLTPGFHGFSADELDRPIYLDGTMGFGFATVRGWVHSYSAAVVIVEAFAISVEAVWLSSRGVKRAFLWSLGANLTSVTVGFASRALFGWP